MKPPPLHGINGRLRRHITNVGAHHANRILAAKRTKNLNKDNYLRELLDSGQITLEQLQKMISEHGRVPSSFEWMQEVGDSILDRADNVFFAKYGRDPTEDADFRLNNDYYKICKNLQRIWQCYDADLEKLRFNYQEKTGASSGTGKIVEEVKYIKVKKVSIVNLVFSFLLSFLLVPFGIAMIGSGIENENWIFLMPPAICFILLALCFYGSFQMSVREKRIIHKCSQCGYEINTWQSTSSCPKCEVCLK
ncbi:MAG: hypothetical protein FVQ82_02695 [Planctomycetes bacterium]|nr:hypothetical protein [Planctomycetota bacterium]